ncbi:helix-turn-helix transcriptional regulator [Paenibacillus ginsengarvi]|uniref:AraC family transcriptional regulator n=1 Tax=Paenibacillus ginsengarvi TaxID=400777 RepID=A0A3B0C3M7_9BACL|nr:AraC family transcriptional regulator [Paenibacillus ginsengarvi]RKN80593.1 AraC family transcriptional regulator [Paenibacillus ginsengarvi]
MLSSFGFRYTDPVPGLLRIYSIGYQVVKEPGYDFHGLRRNAEGMLFQYTLSGSGYLEAEGRLFPVPKDRAFLVEIPGDHRYYYEPSSGKPWEVLWIRFGGELAATYWEQLCNRGRVLSFERDSKPIRLLFQLYGDVKGGRLGGAVDQSVRIYEWLLHVWDEAARPGKPELPHHEAVFPRAVLFMNEQYHRPLTLEDIANEEKLSKYHFCKQFHRKIGMSPIAYLNKVRMEEAVSLLSTTSLPVADIARLTGFETPGYFAKVFKRLVGGTPTEYRDSRHEPAPSVMRIY